MPQELLPGTFTRLFTRVSIEGDVRSKTALAKLARVVETKGKQNLAQSSHRYGTPTPARPGGPPAIISGNLRRSVTHSPVVGSFGNWSTKVGTAAGFYASYQGKRKTINGTTPSSKYGMYLERYMLRNGAGYPWLKPAYQWGITVAGPSIWKESFSGKW